MTITTTLVVVVVAVALVLGAVRWYTFWKPHALKFSQSGYTPPRTSMFGKFWFNLAARFLVFMTVGPVEVVGDENRPEDTDHVIYVSNHQLPPDFAMLRIGAGRHFRMLTSREELGGFFGVISAFMGVISVGFNKGEGALAEAACVDAVAAEKGSLGIFPPGALLPDNVQRKEEYRPGAVRMARSALAKVLERQEKVQIVPMGILYHHDPVRAHWSHRLLANTRSMWPALRNPKNWDPIFKGFDLDALPADERARVEVLREQKLKAYKRSKVTNYGGVVVVGKPISIEDLPEEPLEAIEVIRLRIVDLLLKARQQ